MQVLKAFAILGIVSLVLSFCVLGASTLLPIIISLFLFHLINALSDGFSFLLRLNRLLSLLLSVVTIFFLFWVPLELASSSLPELMEVSPLYQKNLEDISKKLFTYFEVNQSEVLAQIRNHTNIPGVISTFATSVASLTGNVMLILLYTAFLLWDQGTYPKKFSQMFNDVKTKARVSKVLNSINNKIRTYLWVKTFLSVLTGVFSYVVLRMVGVDFAIFWAVVIFFLNYIPTIGSIIGVVFPAIMALMQFESLYPFVIVFFGCGTTQFLIGNFLEPKMMGNSLNLSTFVILFSLMFWGGLWGIVGAFISVPMTVVLMIVFSEFESTKKVAILLSGTGNVEDTSPFSG